VPEKARICVGDFLISRANTLELVGACVIVHQVNRPVFLSDKVLRLVMPDAWKPWLLLNLQSPNGRKEIESRSSGNQLSMRNLSQANLRETPVPIPPIDERDEIVRRTQKLLGFATALEQKCAVAASRVDEVVPSLLSKAFRGELVPQDSNDEPASVLLERIRTEQGNSAVTKPKRVRKLQEAVSP
jgi:type I restriction enzyme S subunit